MTKELALNTKVSDIVSKVEIPLPAAFHDDGPYHGCKPDFSTDFLGMFLTSEEERAVHESS
jgi:hypothetical protein